MPTTYMDGTLQTDTILPLDSNFVPLMRCKAFFPGNGVDSYSVLSALFTQDDHSVVVTVNGVMTFDIPAFGRWSDYSSIVGFTIPGHLHFLTIRKFKVPILSVGDVIPGYDPMWSEGAILNRNVAGKILELNFNGTWYDEARDASPHEVSGVSVGSTYLQMDHAEHFKYLYPISEFPEYSNNITCEIRFASDFDGGIYSSLDVFLGGVTFGFEINAYGVMKAHCKVHDNDSEYIDYGQPYVAQPWVPYTLKVVLSGTTAGFYINDELLSSGSIPATYNFAILESYIEPQVDNAFTHTHIDYFKIYNYTPTSINTTEVTSTETITVTDNTLIQVGDTITITGTSA
jgi:hypothetical protein